MGGGGSRSGSRNIIGEMTGVSWHVIQKIAHKTQ